MGKQSDSNMSIHNLKYIKCCLAYITSLTMFEDFVYLVNDVG